MLCNFLKKVTQKLSSRETATIKHQDIHPRKKLKSQERRCYTVKKLKDKKIKIVKLQQAKDEDGFSINEWIPIHNSTLWEYYRQLSEKEFYASKAVQLDEECLFVISYRDDITTDMEIEYSGKYYDITHIDDFEEYKSDISIYAKLAPK